MPYTIEKAKEWESEFTEELDASRLNCDDETVNMLNRVMPEKSRELWNSGTWLGNTLRDLGATDEQVVQIQMAQGQRAFGGCGWQAAVHYANEFEANGDTEEKGGAELAEKRHRELFG